MKTKAIIFDKDGTLIDFDSFWVTISLSAIAHILKELDREDIPSDELILALGVKNGITDIDGILCKGTYEQIALVLNEILQKHGCIADPDDMVKMVVDAYNQNADSGIIRATCDNIRDVLCKLKNEGIKLFVVTTDNSEITHKCLLSLGIEDLFDKIYTDDGKTPVKPNPACVFEISNSFGIDIDNIVMVGDTMTDVTFAKNAGIRVIGVGSNSQNRQRLGGYADAVVPDVSYVFDVIKGDK